MNDIKILIPESKLKPLREQDYNNKDIVLGIRPEDIHDEPLFIDSSPETLISAHIEVAELMGSETILYSKVDNQDFVARVDSRTDAKSEDHIKHGRTLNKAPLSH